jgi:hypothetical protein
MVSGEQLTDQKTVRKLEKELTETMADVIIVRLRLKRAGCRCWLAQQCSPTTGTILHCQRVAEELTVAIMQQRALLAQFLGLKTPMTRRYDACWRNSGQRIRVGGCRVKVQGTRTKIQNRTQIASHTAPNSGILEILVLDDQLE